MIRIFAFLLLSIVLARGDFRVSEVAEGEREGTTAFEYEGETLHVEDTALFTAEDVAFAMPSPGGNGVTVTLAEEAGNRLSAATAEGVGIKRLAIVWKGGILTAPRIRAPLGRNFEITGLSDHIESAELAARLSGKSEEEVKAAKEKAARSPKEPQPEPTYHTDEEYANLKRAREKAHIYYLDRLPDDEELDRRLRKEMTEEEVISEFGPFSSAVGGAGGSVRTLTYTLAPERRSISNKMRPDSFDVRLSGGKVTGWKISRYSTASREGKSAGGAHRNLLIRFPRDFPEGPPGAAGLLEKLDIELRAGTTGPTRHDLVELLSLVANTALNDPEGTATVAADAPVIALLAEWFPEFVEAISDSGNERLEIKKLAEIAHSYFNGEKSFPDPSAE